MIDENFVYVGIAIYSIGMISYIRDVLRGDVKPNKISWALWSLAPLIASFAMIWEGVGPQSLSILIIGIGSLSTLIASFITPKANWKINNFDLICGGLSIVGLILWLITADGSWAIFFAIVSDALAALPTVTKAYTAPESETSFGWFGDIANTGLALLALKSWTFESAAFDVYWFVTSVIIFMCVQFKVKYWFERGKVKKKEG